ncbi:MAG: hypothetical protein ACT4O5_10925 [Gammaproteobacteria bacterium]
MSTQSSLASPPAMIESAQQNLGASPRVAGLVPLQLAVGAVVAAVAMGVPIELLPVLFAVEMIPDVFRTVSNVTADLVWRSRRSWRGRIAKTERRAALNATTIGLSTRASRAAKR